VSTGENRALAYRWFEEVWNRGNAAAIDELARDKFVLHHPARPGQAVDVTTYRQLFPVYQVALPDLHIVVEDTVAEDDKLAVRITQSGTHLGDYRGNPPSGTARHLDGTGDPPHIWRQDCRGVGGRRLAGFPATNDGAGGRGDVRRGLLRALPIVG
jgi:predicted ester cyclase